MVADKMRSRTEMVTTTFVDSEEDYSDDDDSEEDWRPSASNKNGKKQKQQKCSGAGPVKRGRKRKNSSGQGNKILKRKVTYEDSEEDEVDEVSDDEYDHDDFETISGSSNKKHTSLPPKKQFSDKNSPSSENYDKTGDTLNLLVYVKDLSGTDINKNNRLCLWRKDNNNLLQKYIRVKTSPEQFLFTSSSVYSSFDDKRITDFYDIKVKSIDSNNRRVKIINPSDLQKISLKDTKNNNNSDDDNLSDEKFDIENKKIYVKPKENSQKKHKPVPKYNGDDDDKDEEEVEEENDEEEDDCDLEEDDDDDIEEDDEDDDD